MNQEQKKHIISLAHKMKRKKDLWMLLNEIKSYELGDRVFPFLLKQVNYHSNPKLNKHRYTSFTIPKKSGGERTIMAPNKGLRLMQFCCNKMLQSLYVVNSNACGFIEGKSIVDGAKIHIGHHYVFNIDLKDFFPSIDQARIWARLQYPPFEFSKGVATVVAGLCCHPMMVERVVDGELVKVERSVLPQGAPTSPILSNIICERLDRRLLGLANRFGLRYSRYADDITFSSMHNVYHEGSEFRKELERIIADQNFRINSSKTHLQGSAERQEVTGLIVNERVNVSRKYVKQIRTMLHNWEMSGYEKASTIFNKNYKSTKNRGRKGKVEMSNVIGGKLEFLRMVKGKDNSTYQSLQLRYEALMATLVRENYY